ncbi:MAG: hypothetical protein Q9218_003010 [Villophora microphyllina]
MEKRPKRPHLDPSDDGVSDAGRQAKRARVHTDPISEIDEEDSSNDESVDLNPTVSNLALNKDSLKYGKKDIRRPQLSDDEIQKRAASKQFFKKHWDQHNARTKANAAGKHGTGIQWDLPPMTELEDMFADLISRAWDHGLSDGAQMLQGNVLKLVTLCSGTEAPMLALQYILDALVMRGIQIHLEHMFSVEIVQYKQAYIEANFHPKILFKDVRDVAKKEKAQTVPGDADMVIAGFSCVDASNLNKNKKPLAAIGESGDTLRAVLLYAKRFRPRLILLENVATASWDTTKAYMENDRSEPTVDIDQLIAIWGKNASPNSAYSAFGSKCDTKDYYIPQTRERGYMLCVDRSKIGREAADALVLQWAVLFATVLPRPASSPAQAFILPGDDIRVLGDKATAASNVDGDKKKKVASEWELCKDRYRTYRENNELGILRPLLKSVEGGPIFPPENWWFQWMRVQPERLKLHVELANLRQAKKGWDPMYKTRIWDLSQNIDRDTDSTKFGIVGCLTPHQIPFFTLRGGPLIGWETMRLQGLPADKLLLGNLTETHIRDLAGNAMSTTVVGAAIVAVLATCSAYLVSGSSSKAFTDKGTQHREAEPVIDVSHLTEPCEIDLASYMRTPMGTLLSSAHSSRRLCQCEGPDSNTDSEVFLCLHCGHTSCRRCKSTYVHSYCQIYDMTRSPPLDFAGLIKQALPLRLSILKNSGGVGYFTQMDWRKVADEQDFDIVLKPLQGALQEEFRFSKVKRTHCWTVFFEAQTFSLQLKLHDGEVEWQLFVKPDKSLPGDSRERALYRHPVARLPLGPSSHDLLSGNWKWCIPVRYSFDVNITGGQYNAVDSWQATLGLPKYKGTKVSAFLDVSIATESAGREHVTRMLASIEGQYQLLPKCETATASLYKKTTREEDGTQVYFFLDPVLNGHPDDDRYVFAKTKHRVVYGETRDVIAQLQEPWKPTDRDVTRKCEIFGRQAPTCWTLQPFIPPRPVTFAMAPDKLAIDVPPGVSEKAARRSRYNARCSAEHMALVSVTIPLDDFDAQISTPGTVPLAKQQAFFERYNWIVERLRIDRLFSNGWVDIDISTHTHTGKCHSCAPPVPPLKWRRIKMKGKNEKSRISPIEDGKQAAIFEKLVKARDPAILVDWDLEHVADATNGRLQISANIAALSHQAMAKLASRHSGDARVRYRVSKLLRHVPGMKLPELTLRNCRDCQPDPYHFPGFRLRPEQSRALTQARLQENPQKFGPFAVQAIAEYYLEYIMLLIMVICSKSQVQLGGILAHEVGFGKTAIILALFDATRSSTLFPTPRKGKISTRATLLLAPITLTHQWRSEFYRFLSGKGYTALVIQDVRTLGRTTVREIQEADFVIVNSKILESESYLEGMSALAGVPKHANTNSRPFQSWLDWTLSNMNVVVERLKTRGLAGMFEVLVAKFVKANADPKLFHDRASVRYRGKAYAQEAVNQDDLDDVEEAKMAELAAKACAIEAENIVKKLLKRFCLHDGKEVSDIKYPILHAIEWDRVVLDEYTYLSETGYRLVATIVAVKRWVLSGTPKMADFEEVKQMISLLNINLGEQIDTPGIIKQYNIKKIHKQQTDAEQFRALYDTKSMNYHKLRHDISQRGLHRYARQDIPEIDVIPVVTRLEAVKMASAELGICVELDKAVDRVEITSQAPTSGPSKMTDSKMDSIKKLLQDADDPVVAKLRITHLSKPSDLEGLDWTAPVVKDHRIGITHAFLERLIFEIGRTILVHQSFVQLMPEMAQESFWEKWMADLKAGKGAPKEVLPQLLRLIATVLADRSLSNQEDDFFMDKAKDKKTDKDELKTSNPSLWKRLDYMNAERLPPIPAWNWVEMHTVLRKQVQICRGLSKEWVDRIRGIRFFDNIGKCQDWGKHEFDDEAGPACAACENGCADPQETKILSACSHIICPSCIVFAATTKQYCPVGICEAVGVSANSWPAIKLSATYNDEYSFKYGAKIGKLIQLLKTEIHPKEQVLLFVQFDSVMDTISEALSNEGISSYCLSEKNKKSLAKDMQAFQEDRGVKARRVLILDATKDTAAGANLTNANHVIFMSTFWSDNQHSYHQSMTQCIGRARRYGQKKTVHVYRIIALNTVDVDLLEWREGKKLVRYLDGVDETFDLVDERGGDHDEADFSTGYLEENGYFDREE